jgi:hypothetical protein
MPFLAAIHISNTNTSNQCFASVHLYFVHFIFQPAKCCLVANMAHSDYKKKNVLNVKTSEILDTSRILDKIFDYAIT